MNEPFNTRPFDIRNHMPEGAKLSDPVAPTGPQGFPGGEYALAQPVTRPSTPWWRQPITVLATGVGVIALCTGIVIGNANSSTPKECEQALGYAEQAIGKSAEGMDALGDAATGSYGAKLKALDTLDGITVDLKRLTPLYQDAKGKCLG